MLALHWPRTHPPKAEVTRLGGIVIKRIAPTTTTSLPSSPLKPALGRHPRRGRQVHRIALAGPMRRATVRSTLLPAPIGSRRRGPVQAQLLLFIVPAGPVVVRLVADARVPGLVWVERAEPSSTARRGGGALVRTCCGAVVARFEFAHLV